MCTYVHVYMYIHTYVHICISTYVYVHVYICTHVYMYIRVHMHVYMCTCIPGFHLQGGGGQRGSSPPPKPLTSPTRISQKQFCSSCDYMLVHVYNIK